MATVSFKLATVIVGSSVLVFMDTTMDGVVESTGGIGGDIGKTLLVALVAAVFIPGRLPCAVVRVTSSATITTTNHRLQHVLNNNEY